MELNVKKKTEDLVYRLNNLVVNTLIVFGGMFYVMGLLLNNFLLRKM